MSEIRLEGITKIYGEESAVNDISLTINDGELFGIIGPSGCGKTTTLRTIAGFETPTEGRVLYDGEDVTNMAPERRNVGLVFQQYALFDNMTVMENVTFGPRMYGIAEEERRSRAKRLLNMLDIGDLGDRNPQNLSGGQQRRVGLARALAIEPRILLLDEPMTGLDAELKRELRREIQSLLDNLDVTSLYVTHDQDLAMAMCDRIAVMNEGVIEQVGTPAEIYESPANAFVANFIGTSNLLRGTLSNGTLDLGFAQITASNLPEVQGEASVVVRPDDLRVGSGPIEAEIRNVFYLGEKIQAIAELPNNKEITVEFDRHNRNIKAGETIELDIDTSNVHVLGSYRTE